MLAPSKKRDPSSDEPHIYEAGASVSSGRISAPTQDSTQWVESTSRIGSTCLGFLAQDSPQKENFSLAHFMPRSEPLSTVSWGVGVACRPLDAKDLPE